MLWHSCSFEGDSGKMTEKECGRVNEKDQKQKRFSKRKETNTCEIKNIKI